MMDAVIRDITKEEVFRDFYKVAAEVECSSFFMFSNPHHDAWLRRRYARHEFCGAKFYASYLKDNIAVGYAILLIDDIFDNENNTLSPKADLLAIGVFKELWGKGYGKQLLEYAEDISRKSGAYSLYISTYSKDHQNIAFYGRNGYIPVATLPFVYGPKDDGQVYVRKIIRKE